MFLGILQRINYIRNYEGMPSLGYLVLCYIHLNSAPFQTIHLPDAFARWCVCLCTYYIMSTEWQKMNGWDHINKFDFCYVDFFCSIIGKYPVTVLSVSRNQYMNCESSHCEILYELQLLRISAAFSVIRLPLYLMYLCVFVCGFPSHQSRILWYPNRTTKINIKRHGNSWHA